jgi:hypothetical protein
VKEVLKAMLMKKLRAVAVGLVVATVALGMVGLAHWTSGGSGTAQAAPSDKPLTELEALRKENELLKLNLQVVLEKVKAQEAELRALRGTKENPEQPKTTPLTPSHPSGATPLGPRGGGQEIRFPDSPATPLSGPATAAPLGVGDLKSFRLKNMAASQATKVLLDVLGSDGKRARVIADERTNQVLVQCSPADLILVEKSLDLLDIPGSD